jgi:hypothetical protein
MQDTAAASLPNDSWLGWVPAKLRWEDTARVQWAYIGAERLSDPFLHHTIARLEAARNGSGGDERRRRCSSRRWTTGVKGLAAAVQGLCVPAQHIAAVGAPAAMVDAAVAGEIVTAAGSCCLRASPRPHAWIFHVSRCGSTLLCNSLRVVSSSSVVSEPGALNDLLLLHALASPGSAASRAAEAEVAAQQQHAQLPPPPPPPPPEEEEEVLDGIVGALCAPRRSAQRCVLKTSSWNVLALRGLLSSQCLGRNNHGSNTELRPRRPLPPPWLFLFRDPVEVAVSQLRSPSGWMRLQRTHPARAAKLFGLCDKDDDQVSGAAAARVCADAPPLGVWVFGCAACRVSGGWGARGWRSVFGWLSEVWCFLRAAACVPPPPPPSPPPPS